MTKKIFRSILLAAVSVLLASLVIIMGCLYDYYRNVQEKQLRDELRLASYGVEADGLDYLEQLASPYRFPSTADFRLTWIAADGEVLFDTHVPAAEMENHAGRAEVKEALAEGESGGVRYSETLTERTLYYAQRLTDGTILRISISQLTVFALAMGMLQPILLTAIIAAILSALLAHRMAKSIVAPLNRLDLDRPLENDAYEELSPLLGRIHQQHRQIEAQLRELRRKTEEFEQITENMSEGLVLLDRKGVILSINPAARAIFHASSACVGQDFLVVDRDHEINLAIQTALEGGHSEVRAMRNDREVQFDISQITADGAAAGTVLLAFDVTEQAAAERSRREFTANVSHELKTPLQSIMGSAELLENGLVKQEDLPQFVGVIRTEAARLVALVEDIIHLSQLDEGIAPAKEEVNLLELARSAASTLWERAEERHIDLSVSGENLMVDGVRSFLYEMLYNLIDNAIKYNIDGGRVELSVSAGDTGITVSVKDTGIGIPPEYQARVFERFFRVDKSRSKASGGTGLGLSIVKHIAQYHHAEIKLHSGNGRGTIIEILFAIGEM
ncbi:sensor histidine kinase [Anaerotruncus colihominis]|uniref:histidine kinase n=1 Tax=Anaerotruncus colihominis TaxID=169435 RepID=A0A845SY67_9FIRM|nr:ATP-binding protein [Anaerotruncus colihominis]MCR2023985.1 ATP-binding protein [Anaerotruncus colihominis]NDO39463.1 PAS domain S-box protein [Anaerotruncus colihominis]